MKYQIAKAVPCMGNLQWIQDPCWHEDGMRAMQMAAELTERGFVAVVMLISEKDHALAVDLTISEDKAAGRGDGEK